MPCIYQQGFFIASVLNKFRRKIRFGDIFDDIGEKIEVPEKPNYETLRVIFIEIKRIF